jgi:MATE family multidrug resistance protein
MKIRKEISQTARLAYPVLIGQLGHMMMGVVDSVMVGQVGATPLAASSVAHGLFILFLIFGIGVSMAISPLVAMAVGSDNLEKIGIVFRQGLLVNMILSILLAIAAFYGSALFEYLNQPPDVTEQAIAYLRVLAISIIPVMLFQTYRQFSEGLSIMNPPMVVTVAANTVNIFANWVLIFGNLGAPALGLVGAGWATFITRSMMGISLMLFMIFSQRFRSFDMGFYFSRIDRQIIRQILKIGVPSGVQYFFEVGAFAGAAIIIGWLGTKELAAHQIAINLASISFMFALSISAAAAIRVGHAVGRSDLNAVRNAGFSAILLSIGIMGSFGILFITLRLFLPSLYIEDTQVIQIASTLLVIAAFFQLSDGTQAVGIGILRGIADTRIPMIITFVAYWIVGLPGGYYLGFVRDMGVNGVWIGLLVALTLSAVSLTWRFNSRSRREISI